MLGNSNKLICELFSLPGWYLFSLASTECLILFLCTPSSSRIDKCQFIRYKVMVDYEVVISQVEINIMYIALYVINYHSYAPSVRYLAL